MWLATREQLRRLSQRRSCGYLNFDESSTKGHVETHSGSIQMFRPNCGFQKVGATARLWRKASLEYSRPYLCEVFMIPPEEVKRCT